tara:strand:+ start:4257 stop:6908 length:2652 start_codon:yes stop_codon:yes gene_type:complete
MASTYSTSLRIQLIGTGDQSGTWGTTTNNNLGTLIEQAITGYQIINIAGLSAYTLTSFNGIPDEARNAVLEFTGALSGNCTVTAPAVPKSYFIQNSTTGGHSIIITTGSGSTVTIPSGQVFNVYSDGTNYYLATNYDATNVNITGGTINNTSVGATTAASGRFTTLQTSGALTYGGVTLDNAVTGLGSMVLNTGPVIYAPLFYSETYSTDNAVTAAGTTQGTATALLSDYNVVTTTPSGSGVALPLGTVGRRIIIVNRGANDLKVYPFSGAAIDALATNAAITLPVNGWMEFNASAITQWYSTLNVTNTTSFSGGPTGLTPNTATTGAVTLGGTLLSGYGGTGFSTYATGDLIYASAANTLAKLTAGTNNFALTISSGVPVWSAVVNSFSGGTTGLTPSSSSTGNVTLGGTLSTANGGTGLGGLTPFTANKAIYASSTSALTSGTLPITAGGTGAATLSAYGVTVVNNTGTALTTVAPGSNGNILTSNGTSWTSAAAPATGVTSISFGSTGLTPNTATTGAVTVAGTLVAGNGGTGQFSYTIGDILYASSSSALSKLADVATGSALISGGIGVAPSYGKIGLTTHVSGTLGTANGGTGLGGLTPFALNGAVYASTNSALTTGTLPVGSGGTGQSSALTSKGIVYGSSTTAMGTTAAGTSGQPLISGGTAGTPAFGTLGISGGGTNSTATATSGGIGYGTGTAHAYTTAGTTYQVLRSNGSSAPSWSNAIVGPTRQVIAGLTNVTYTGLSTNYTRHTIVFNDVQQGGTSLPIVQIGDTVLKLTSYEGSSSMGTSAVSLNTGFSINSASSSNRISGTITLLKGYNNGFNYEQWYASGTFAFASSALTGVMAGNNIVDNSGLTIIKITTVNGTDIFSNGGILLYSE